MSTQKTTQQIGRQRNRFDKNPDLDALLLRINDFLRCAEQSQPTPPPLDYPLIVLVGAPRSGTTLFMQWLNSTGQIAVPSNLISRLYASPAFGVMLQHLLTDPKYRYRDEFDELPTGPAHGFGSDFGKTSGLLGHNSFFYFWRQYIPLAESAPLHSHDWSRVDGAGLKQAIARYANEAKLPLAMKGYLVQYHLGLLNILLERVLFIHITRNPLDTMRSLLQVRRSLFGNEETWWGCRPPGIEAFYDQPPAVQVAGQIALTDRSIRAELASMKERQHLEISYEQLCDRPAEVWFALRDKISALTASNDKATAIKTASYNGPESFQRSHQPQNDIQLSAAWAIANKLTQA